MNRNRTNRYREVNKWITSAEQLEEFDRALAKELLAKILPESREWYESLVQKGIIDPEVKDALFNENRDPLDRQATLERIHSRVDEWVERGKRDQMAKMIIKLQDENDRLKEMISQQRQVTVTPLVKLPEKPPVPGADGYTWDDVFDWYYRTPRRICPKVQDLAALLGKSKRTVERYKEGYDAQYDCNQLPDEISKFA